MPQIIRSQQQMLRHQVPNGKLFSYACEEPNCGIHCHREANPFINRMLFQAGEKDEGKIDTGYDPRTDQLLNGFSKAGIRQGSLLQEPVIVYNLLDPPIGQGWKLFSKLRERLQANKINLETCHIYGDFSKKPWERLISFKADLNVQGYNAAQLSVYARSLVVSLPITTLYDLTQDHCMQLEEMLKAANG